MRVKYIGLGERHHPGFWEILRKTNKGSCILLKLKRISPEFPAMFQQMYLFLASMKDDFKVGCKLLIGLDMCFLKGSFKGKLL